MAQVKSTVSALVDRDAAAEQAAKRWLAWDKNPKTKAAVEKMIADENKDELRAAFGSSLAFGTAGMRATMGAGSARMNDLTIIQTTQGLCKYLQTCFDDIRKRGVVIGYDARAHPPSDGSSKRFARLAAQCFTSQGIPVHLFSSITPTPFVPYTVLHMKLCAGIMVTASHNPKQDNGYKVYWDNGAQVISPHEAEIGKAVEKNLEPWKSAWDDNLIDTSPVLHDPLATMNHSYMEDLQKHCHHREINKESHMKFVHTSVHGVGHTFVQSAFKAFDFKPPIAVAEQQDPDPEFPTVKLPNPEEGKEVLTLAMALADRENAKVILANDPDADRLAVAEKEENGQWRVFSGNQLGALLGWWIFTCWKLKHEDHEDLKNIYMLSSTVSSKILRTIALKEGFHFEETLTGFKWMGNRAKQLSDQGKTVLFAFEEAIGYMCCPFVLDKDGVSAAAIAAEMAAYLATKNMTLTKQLEAVYTTYGHHVTKASYFMCHDAKIIKSIFTELRNFGCKDRYPKTCGRFEVAYVRDLTTGFDSSQPDKKAILPTSKSSQMITFTFANGGVATIRTSGTEPKIKYYVELSSPPGDGVFEKLKGELDELTAAIEEHFLQPEKNNLQAKTD